MGLREDKLNWVKARLEHLDKVRGIPNKDVAIRLGHQPTYMTKVKNGLVSDDFIDKLCKEFGLTFELPAAPAYKSFPILEHEVTGAIRARKVKWYNEALSQLKGKGLSVPKVAQEMGVKHQYLYDLRSGTGLTDRFISGFSEQFDLVPFLDTPDQDVLVLQEPSTTHQSTSMFGNAEQVISELLEKVASLERMVKDHKKIHDDTVKDIFKLINK